MQAAPGMELLPYLIQFVKAVGPFWFLVMLGGPLGAFVLVGWLNLRWQDRRDERKEAQLDRVLEQYRGHMDEALKQFRDHMADFNEKYDNNVLLVEETQRIAKQVVGIAGELSSVVVLNTQVQTTLVEQIRNNLFCPMVRKEAGR